MDVSFSHNGSFSQVCAGQYIARASSGFLQTSGVLSVWLPLLQYSILPILSISAFLNTDLWCFNQGFHYLSSVWPLKAGLPESCLQVINSMQSGLAWSAFLFSVITVLLVFYCTKGTDRILQSVNNFTTLLIAVLYFRIIVTFLDSVLQLFKAGSRKEHPVLFTSYLPEQTSFQTGFMFFNNSEELRLSDP